MSEEDDEVYWWIFQTLDSNGRIKAIHCLCQPPFQPMPREVLINTVHTFFFLSADVVALYLQLTPSVERSETWSYYYIPRDDPDLIRAAKTIGVEKAGRCPSVLKIVLIPDDVGEWEIVDDDGKECVMEKNRRTWS